MHTYAGIMRHRLFVLVVPCTLMLIFALTACGTNTTTGSAPGATVTTTLAATATATQGQATAEGCPSSTPVTTAPPAANVVLTNANTGTTINAKKGDIIQVDLAFGHKWQGPLTNSQNLLAAQGPAGYVSNTAKACVWRFQAVATGTAHLSFAGRPICKKDQVCPMYILDVPFTIDIK
ncbi:MAG TPA: hypothetical protein VF458_19790 [Ktedonobacteraceae bacterium]